MVLTAEEREVIGTRRAAFRTLKRISQERLAELAAERLGRALSIKAVYAAEAGRSVDDEKLRAMAAVLGVPFHLYADPPDPVAGSSR